MLLKKEAEKLSHFGMLIFELHHWCCCLGMKSQENWVEISLLYADGQFTKSNIMDFVFANKLPLVNIFTRENAPSIFDNPIKKQVSHVPCVQPLSHQTVLLHFLFHFSFIFFYLLFYLAFALCHFKRFWEIFADLPRCCKIVQGKGNCLLYLFSFFPLLSMSNPLVICTFSDFIARF